MPTNAQSRKTPGVHERKAGLWRPLLDGTVREQALETVREIADSLRETCSPAANDNFSLAGGHAGLAVLFAYLDGPAGRFRRGWAGAPRRRDDS
jgi:hypothetical protein